jgi:hypothetical protein
MRSSRTSAVATTPSINSIPARPHERVRRTVRGDLRATGQASARDPSGERNSAISGPSMPSISPPRAPWPGPRSSCHLRRTDDRGCPRAWHQDGESGIDAYIAASTTRCWSWLPIRDQCRSLHSAGPPRSEPVVCLGIESRDLCCAGSRRDVVSEPAPAGHWVRGDGVVPQLPR